MKIHYISLTHIIIFLAFNSLVVIAQDSTKTRKTVANQTQVFIDEDGDGYNDLAPDHDGDGIPNGLDPDWQKMKRKRVRQYQFIDSNGDGINDHLEVEQIKGNQEMQHSLYQEKGSSLQNDENKNSGKGKGNDQGKNK
jgi:hypothetical protein